MSDQEKTFEKMLAQSTDPHDLLVYADFLEEKDQAEKANIMRLANELMQSMSNWSSVCEKMKKFYNIDERIAMPLLSFGMKTCSDFYFQIEHLHCACERITCQKLRVQPQ